MSSSHKHHHSSSSRNNGSRGGSSEYTYPSYTTFGTTYSTTNNNYSYSTNTSATPTPSSTTQHIRVKVSRKKDENGKYLPHKHEHSTNDGKKKHRVVKHKDGIIAATDVFPETTGTHEELDPVTTGDLTGFSTLTETTETAGTFTNAGYDKHHHHRGYDREHHKWAVKKRNLDLLKLKPKIDIPEDQTFTALGYEEPDEIPRNCPFREVEMSTTMEAEQSIIDTMSTVTTTTTTTDTFGQPIPAVELFPDIIEARRRNMTRGLADAGCQPDEDAWDPKKTEELRRAIYLKRDKLYPKRRKNVMYENPLPPPPGLEDYADQQRASVGVDMASTLRQQELSERAPEEVVSNQQQSEVSQREVPPPFKPPESEPNIEPAQFKFDQVQKYMEQAEPGSVRSPRKILTNKEILEGAKEEELTPKRNRHTPQVKSSTSSRASSKSASVNSASSKSAGKSSEKAASFKSGSSKGQKGDEKAKPNPSVSFYSDVDSSKKPDLLTSVTELVTANSKSAEFVEIPNQENGVKFIEVSEDMVPAAKNSDTKSSSTSSEYYEEEDSDNDDSEEEEEEEEDYSYEDDN